MSRSARARERLLYFLSPIALLALWEFLIQIGIGDRRFIPTPSDVAVSFVTLLLDGTLLPHVAATLWRAAAGFVLGVVPGILVGLLMSMFQPAHYFFDPLIAALFPIPKIALMPLILMWFGFGDASKIAPVAIGVFFPVAVNTYAGAANINQLYLDVAKNYGASWLRTFYRVVFFGALPMIFAGLRIAVSVAFLILVAAEFVSSKNGIGFLIWNSWQLLEVDRMFVGIVLIGLIGVAAAILLRELERLAIPWSR